MTANQWEMYLVLIFNYHLGENKPKQANIEIFFILAFERVNEIPKLLCSISSNLPKRETISPISNRFLTALSRTIK